MPVLSHVNLSHPRDRMEANSNSSTLVGRLAFMPAYCKKVTAMRMFFLAILLVTSPAIGQTLPPRMQRTIETELVPAYTHGDVVSVLQFGASIANNVEPKLWPLVDKAFRRHGLPPLDELIVNSRLEFIQANFARTAAGPDAS